VTGLDRALERAAAARVLLVASDFDGTLSPIVNDPARAEPMESGRTALIALADLPDTHVAVVSGRALADLRTRVRMPEHIHLVGGHGTEIAAFGGDGPSAEQLELRDRIARELDAIAGTAPGFTIERKPGSVAFHYRNADPSAAAVALEDVRNLARGLDSVRVREGKKVVELNVIEGDKGAAIRQLAHWLNADITLYIGDDVTDEDAFAALGDADLGIKVGPGETRAPHRIADPQAVAAVLRELLARRSARQS
jgi:trehalose 6-phosphate phosphatase